MKLNYEEILNYTGRLEKHKGVIPLLLITYIDINNYYKNLRRTGDYDTVIKKIHDRRRKTMYFNTEEQLKFEEQELIQFIKDNPVFADVIIDGE